MKKIVSILLIVFMLATPCAYASSPIEMATQAKEIIELFRGQEITEYYYTNVLCITILALANHYHQLEKNGVTLFDDVAETGGDDMISSLTGIFPTLKGAKYNHYIDLVRDAEMCYTTRTFSFDVIEKNIDFILAFE